MAHFSSVPTVSKVGGSTASKVGLSQGRVWIDSIPKSTVEKRKRVKAHVNLGHHPPETRSYN